MENALNWPAIRLMTTIAVLGLTALPAVAKTGARTIKITAEKVEKGSRLYTLCAACHGSAEGEKQAMKKTPKAALLTSKTVLEATTDAELILAIEEGRAGTAMAGWKDVLTRDQTESIIAMLRALNETKPAKLNNGPLKGDAENGAKVFARSCGICHKRGEASYREWGTGIVYKAYLSQVSNGFLRHIIANGASGTSMKGFQKGLPLPEMNLSDQQIDDVIAYLRKNARDPSN